MTHRLRIRLEAGVFCGDRVKRRIKNGSDDQTPETAGKRYTAADGAEITGIVVQIGIGKLVDEAVEAFFEEGKHLSFTPAILVSSYHVVIRIFLQKSNNSQHFQQLYRQ